jgi:hypothetical protein
VVGICRCHGRQRARNADRKPGRAFLQSDLVPAASII